MCRSHARSQFGTTSRAQLDDAGELVGSTVPGGRIEACIAAWDMLSSEQGIIRVSREDTAVGKRSNGEGSIRWREARQAWELRYTPPGQKQKSVYVKGDKKEAQAKLREIL